ncbi:MAG: Nramp family divalent metal transporter [Candidatus Doudnabacteria bacterium]|nr:Nramp family divalent metal transporter [Candidatus Doudnabacteria bacterium]
MKIKIKTFFKKSIPGFITGAADNDPSGITTYSVSGALFGFSQLWIVLLATPMLIAMQSTCARIANVTRKGLAEVLQTRYSRTVAWIATAILIISNVATIGADILAVAFALEILTHVALSWWLLPVAGSVLYLVIFKNYRAIRKFLLLMIIFFLSYYLAAFLAKPDWTEVLRGLFVPSLSLFDQKFFAAALAILGTTITPYLFFWEAKEELEEHRSSAEAKSEAKHEDRVNAPGLIFSQLTTVFIIIATGATLHASGQGISSAIDAARALAPIAGNLASALFAVGIIGAGLLALPVLTITTAETVAEMLGFKHHRLDNKPKVAKQFYLVVALSLLAGVLLLLVGLDPLRALYYSQILAGLISPVLIVFILLAANDKTVMGQNRNSGFDNIFGSLAAIVMVLAAVFMFTS